MTDQELLTAGEAELAKVEAAIVQVKILMGQAGDDPFADAQCNARWRKLKRDWTKIQQDVLQWHDDMYACIGDGDPTLNFGGGK